MVTEKGLIQEKVKIGQIIGNPDDINVNITHNDENRIRVIYNGRKSKRIKTDYGENDFLINYENKYYYKFRHFIENNNFQHDYYFRLSKREEKIYVDVHIEGPNKLNFIEPLIPMNQKVGDSKQRCTLQKIKTAFREVKTNLYR